MMGRGGGLTGGGLRGEERGRDEAERERL